MVEALLYYLEEGETLIALGSGDALGEKPWCDGRLQAGNSVQQLAVGVVHPSTPSVVARTNTVAEAGGASSASGGGRVPEWFDRPEAIDLLVSLIAEPPLRERRIDMRFRQREESVRYVGDRVDRLHRIRYEVICAATGIEPDEACALEAIQAWMREEDRVQTVDDVIEDVLVAAGVTVVETEVRL